MRRRLATTVLLLLALVIALGAFAPAVGAHDLRSANAVAHPAKPAAHPAKAAAHPAKPAAHPAKPAAHPAKPAAHPAKPAAHPAKPAAHPAKPARIDLPVGWQPEGITAGRGSTIFVGSLADGAIWRGSVRSGNGAVFVPGAAGRVAVGVDFDRARNRLWVVGGATGEVRAYNARTGALLQTYTFSPAGFLNDLVVTRTAVYVTDSFLQQLDVIPLGRHGALPPPAAARTLPLTGDITFAAGAFNANGIVALGRWLIVVQSNTGQLFRVDPRTGAAKQIDLHGATVTAGDGLELRGHTLYVVRNSNQVDVFRLGAHLLKAAFRRTITSPDLDVPTTAALQAGKLWVVNARFSTPPTPATAYWITRLPAAR